MKKLNNALKCSIATVGAFAALAVASVPNAQAGGFALREQSAVGQGASFAGVAAGGSLSSVFWNPATLTQVQGVQTESVFSAIIPVVDVASLTTTPAAYKALGDPGDVGLDAVIPASYSGVQLTDRLYFGTSVNSPFGMATKPKVPSATRFHSSSAKIFTVDIKGNIAYRFNDAFSIGAGVGAAYAKIRMKSVPGGNGHRLQGDDWAPVFSVGATFKPFDSTTIGVGYRSQTNLKLTGTELHTVRGSSNISADLDLPETVTIGLRQEVTDRIAFLAGFEWSGWSSVKDPVPINGSALGTSLHLGYNDGWYASAGMEYAHSDELTLRTGLGFEKSPVPDNHRNLRLSDADRVWASVGASYSVTDKLGIDVGYSHLFVEKGARIAARNAAGSYVGKVDASVDIISASLRYKWKPEALFAGDDPIERKY